MCTCSRTQRTAAKEIFSYCRRIRTYTHPPSTGKVGQTRKMEDYPLFNGDAGTLLSRFVKYVQIGNTPLSLDLLDLVSDINTDVLTRDPELKSQLPAAGQLERLHLERHEDHREPTRRWTVGPVSTLLPCENPLLVTGIQNDDAASAGCRSPDGQSFALLLLSAQFWWTSSARVSMSTTPKGTSIAPTDRRLVPGRKNSGGKDTDAATNL